MKHHPAQNTASDNMPLMFANNGTYITFFFLTAFSRSTNFDISYSFGGIKNLAKSPSDAPTHFNYQALNPNKVTSSHAVI